jgi:hypothetical protein
MNQNVPDISVCCRQNCKADGIRNNNCEAEHHKNVDEFDRRSCCRIHWEPSLKWCSVCVLYNGGVEFRKARDEQTRKLFLEVQNAALTEGSRIASGYDEKDSVDKWKEVLLSTDLVFHYLIQTLYPLYWGDEFIVQEEFMAPMRDELGAILRAHRMPAHELVLYLKYFDDQDYVQLTCSTSDQRDLKKEAIVIVKAFKTVLASRFQEIQE